MRDFYPVKFLNPWKAERKKPANIVITGTGSPTFVYSQLVYFFRNSNAISADDNCPDVYPVSAPDRDPNV